MRCADRDQDDPVEQSPTVPLPTPAPEAPLTLLDRLGGPWGLVGTGVPQVVFALLSNVTTLPVTAGVAFAVAAVLAVARRWRGEPLSTALGGVLGVAVAAGIALWTGSAADYFLVGIVASTLALVGCLVSLAAGRPVTALAWNAVHGGGHPWRADRPSRRAHVVATVAAATMFAARAAVSGWLWWLDATAGLALARLVLGVPLTALVAIVVLWAFRRSTTRLVTPARVAAPKGPR
ncbi:hypothetical protein GCM10023200_37500 [Actinomycetospora chlora]|uniref:DUF3159 domain-containing protein n=1 Tax=Actinomycetospora chlora TaxID=663608 RepID=A0ABP9BN32_9PSEU